MSLLAELHQPELMRIVAKESIDRQKTEEQDQVVKDQNRIEKRYGAALHQRDVLVKKVKTTVDKYKGELCTDLSLDTPAHSPMEKYVNSVGFSGDAPLYLRMSDKAKASEIFDRWEIIFMDNNNPEGEKLYNTIKRDFERIRGLTNIIKTQKTAINKIIKEQGLNQLAEVQKKHSSAQIPEDQVPDYVLKPDGRQIMNPYKHIDAESGTEFAGHASYFKWPSTESLTNYLKMEEMLNKTGRTFKTMYASKQRSNWHWFAISDDGKVVWRKYASMGGSLNHIYVPGKPKGLSIGWFLRNFEGEKGVNFIKKYAGTYNG